MKALQLQTHPASAAPPVTVALSDLTDLADWIKTQAALLPASDDQKVWLLAHADDGINWGSVLLDDAGGALVTSRDALDEFLAGAPAGARQRAEAEIARDACPPLRAQTLQQLRLFNAHAELLLWRVGDGSFRNRTIRNQTQDTAANWLDCYDERQLVWGTHGIDLRNGFTLLRDGAQGLRHAVPRQLEIDGNGKLTTPPRLLVRHYLAKDEPFARVAASRLVRLV